MKIAYLDCFSGISGNMALGALLHAGLEKEILLSELDKLDLSGYRIQTQPSRRCTISGIFFQVIVEKEQPERNLEEILALIDKSRLSEQVREQSRAIFQLLGEAEARVHGLDLSAVHFHEVGAVDSIVDIVGSVVGMEALGIARLVASPVNLGKGTVATRHGTIPVPAPATLALLKGKPTYSAGPSMELTTPTGASLLAGLARDFGEQPLMRIEAIGYGLGSADPSGWPNCLRILIGEESERNQDHCWMIESNIDDMNPELYGFVMDRLFAEGALDVFLTPIIMKKARPATRLSVLAPPGKEEALTKVLFLETTAIGMRRYRVERRKLSREVLRVRTPYGEVPVKIAYFQGEVVTCSPEYEACRKLAAQKGVPLKRVYEEALHAARGSLK